MINPHDLLTLINLTGVRHIPGGFLAVDTEDVRVEVSTCLFHLGIVGLPVRVDSRAPTDCVIAVVDEGAS